MPCFANEDIARVYHSPKDDLISSLITPLLRSSVRIRRSTGDVQSTALMLYHEALAEFLERNPVKGAIRWLTSNRVSKRDLNALRNREAYLLNDVIQSLRTGPPKDREGDNNWGPRIIATLIEKGFLEWKVVLPETKGMYHEKAALFDDPCGHTVLLSGSWNETLAGYCLNSERIDVHKSFEEPDRCDEGSTWFEKVWNEEIPELTVMHIDDAISREMLIEVENEPPSIPKKRPSRPELWTPELMFLAIQDKLLPDLRDPYVGTLVDPLPHQSYIHGRVLSRQPPRFLLADEVGLGKTIEAGMIVSTMVATGHARRILILAPKNVIDQWHEELWEKFQLTSWKYENGYWYDSYSRKQIVTGEGIFDRLPEQEPKILLVSRSLAMRSERLDELKRLSWDIVILDEAHKARSRKEGIRYRRNNLLIALETLSEKTDSLLLLTATPVQLELHELYDLLRPLGLPEKWDRESFRNFINLISGEGDSDWHLLFDLAAESERFYKERFGLSEIEFDKDLKAGIEFFEDLPPEYDQEATFAKLLDIVRLRAYHRIVELSKPEQRLLKIALYRMSPIYQLTCRTTRNLLRRYHEMGVIRERIPQRKLEEPILVEFEQDEKELYEFIRENYLKPFYEAYSRAGISRNNVGFVLSIYAKRAASSWFGLKKSIERRLERVRRALEKWDTDGVRELFGRTAVQDLASEGATEAEMDTELEGAEEIEEKPSKVTNLEEIRNIAEKERNVLEELVQRLEDLLSHGTDSKKNRVIEDIPKIVGRRRGLIIFSQFKDTIDDLADSLIPEYGSALAKYHGNGGEVWNGSGWDSVDKSEVETMVKSNRIRVLVATDAASEGLNLQAFDALMNYDLPWNPMKIEQRIGRIDRLNQQSEDVSIYVVIPRNTVEEEVYSRCVERIGLFKKSLGPLQPILIEDFVSRAILEGEDIGTAIDRAIDEWSTARKHTELVEQALASVIPADKWNMSRDIEESALQQLLLKLGYEPKGQVWVRDGDKISLRRSIEEAEILSAAASNRKFQELIAELGEIPRELRVDNAVYKLVSGGGSLALVVKPSENDGWYFVRDLTHLDGRGEKQIGVTEQDVKHELERLATQRRERTKQVKSLQRFNRLDSWKEDVKHSVLGPLIRHFSGDYEDAAKEIAHRETLLELMKIYMGINREINVEEIANFLSYIKVEPRGPKKNLGLIITEAEKLLKKKP